MDDGDIFFEINKNCKIWYKIINGKSFIHKDDDLPAIEHSDGRLDWLSNGTFHRLYAPAVMYGVFELWYVNGTYIPNDVIINFIHEYRLPDWQKWTNEHKMLFRLRF
jgi:hypothetical protein